MSAVELVQLKIKVVEHKTVKQLAANPKDTVAFFRATVAEMLGDDPALFTFFKPANEEELGQWLRDDYPLDFYVFNQTSGGDSVSIMTSSEQKRKKKPKQTSSIVSLFFFFFFLNLSYERVKQRYFEWRRTARAVKVILGQDRLKSFLIDDTLRVGDLIGRITSSFGNGFAIAEEVLLEQNENESQYQPSALNVSVDHSLLTKEISFCINDSRPSLSRYDSERARLWRRMLGWIVHQDAQSTRAVAIGQRCTNRRLGSLRSSKSKICFVVIVVFFFYFFFFFRFHRLIVSSGNTDSLQRRMVDEKESGSDGHFDLGEAVVRHTEEQTLLLQQVEV